MCMGLFGRAVLRSWLLCWKNEIMGLQEEPEGLQSACFALILDVWNDNGSVPSTRLGY